MPHKLSQDKPKQQWCIWTCAFNATCLHVQTVWPSGLRRWLQAPVRKGVGSNPTAVICVALALGRPDTLGRSGALWVALGPSVAPAAANADARCQKSLAPSCVGERGSKLRRRELNPGLPRDRRKY